MMNELQRLYELVSAGTAPEEEHARFLDLLVRPEHEQIAKEMLIKLSDEVSDISVTSDEERWALIRESVLLAGRAIDVFNSKPVVHRVHFIRRRWFQYAAAILLLAGGAALWYLRSNDTGQPTIKPGQSVADIRPGTNQAILTIGDSVINLSGNKSGIITVSNSVAYNDGERIADAGQMLTLHTPRGGQYQAILPDGTKVWLNAASSIKFPSTFAKDRREIVVTGEIYIEAAQNVRSPFYVKTTKATVEVLGTDFTINAYDDEPIERTTLIEGRVKVTDNERNGLKGGSVILQPGQQAQLILRPDNDQIVIVNNQSEAALAWKKGYFSFKNTELKEMARQLERWYDIKIEFIGKIPDKSINGAMDRGVSLSGVVRFLNDLGLSADLQGKTLILKRM